MRGRQGDLPVARVLVVEDDRHLRSVVVEALADEGYEVVSAASGMEALSLLGPPAGGRTLGTTHGFSPHVILLDMRMPVMDGPAFAQEYRRRPQPLAPIIVLTASTTLAAAAEALGPVEVIAKPFNVAHLLERVASVLGAT